MEKVKINYWVDFIIGIAFLVCTVSGLVFLIPLEWLNHSAGTLPTVLGLDYMLWDTLHTWSGILMALGVFTHLVLHFKWMVRMTLKMFGKNEKQTVIKLEKQSTEITTEKAIQRG